MKAIHFTQFLRPHGEKRDVSIERSPEVLAMAAELVKAGYRFEIEVLTTGEIHMDCSRPEDDEPLALEVCDNGPDALEAVDRLVRKAHERKDQPQECDHSAGYGSDGVCRECGQDQPQEG